MKVDLARPAALLLTTLLPITGLGLSILAAMVNACPQSLRMEQPIEFQEASCCRDHSMNDLYLEPNMNPTRAYKPLSVFGVSLVCAALLGGCANTEAVGKAQSTADQALQKANEASAEAAQASQKAEQAMTTAQEAKASADQANATANAAKVESEKAMQEVNALSEKVDRMFKKTMQK